jgi:hypothetical protein
LKADSLEPPVRAGLEKDLNGRCVRGVSGDLVGEFRRLTGGQASLLGMAEDGLRGDRRWTALAEEAKRIGTCYSDGKGRGQDRSCSYV